MARKAKKKAKRRTKRKAKRKTKRKASKSRRRRGGAMPLSVIEQHARKLKRNKRAAAVYRKVLAV